MNKLAYLIFILSISMTGCCRTTTLAQPDTDPAAVKLAEAASSISHSLVTLAEVEQAQLPAKKACDLPDPDKLNMPDVVSVDWSGPVEPFLQKMAQASGYCLRILGVKPAIPIIVTITAHNTPLANVLRDTAFQCMTKADVMVYPNKKIIELRYAKA